MAAMPWMIAALGLLLAGLVTMSVLYGLETRRCDCSNKRSPPVTASRTGSAAGRDLHLYVNYFISPNAERNAENRLSLDRNAALGVFAAIHLVVDAEFDQAAFALPPGALFHVIPNRPTFADFFALANTIASDRTLSIIANTDIEFTPSIALVRNYDWDGKRTAMCVSRDDAMKSISQDAWIWAGRADVRDTAFLLGKLGCDGAIAQRFVASGYAVINPCHTVRLIHHHASQVRTYSHADRAPGRRYHVTPSQMVFE